jgi:hypothetical protein
MPNLLSSNLSLPFGPAPVRHMRGLTQVMRIMMDAGSTLRTYS